MYTHEQIRSMAEAADEAKRADLVRLLEAAEQLPCLSDVGALADVAEAAVEHRARLWSQGATIAGAMVHAAMLAGGLTLRLARFRVIEERCKIVEEERLHRPKVRLGTIKSGEWWEAWIA